MSRKTEAFVSRHERIGLDTNIAIALIEGSPSYERSVLGFFRLVGLSDCQMWLSVVSLPELLIKPTKERADVTLARYQEWFIDLSFAVIDLVAAEQAVELGAQNGLKPADALILASLEQQGVTGFVTADERFRRIKELDVLLLRG